MDEGSQEHWLDKYPDIAKIDILPGINPRWLGCEAIKKRPIEYEV